MKTFVNENTIILNKLYNFPTNILTILLINYLFLTLIAVVKITNIFEGPLRPKY
jgi:NADH-ubiquinone oxidoreductase chain 6